MLGCEDDVDVPPALALPNPPKLNPVEGVAAFEEVDEVCDPKEEPNAGEGFDAPSLLLEDAALAKLKPVLEGFAEPKAGAPVGLEPKLKPPLLPPAPNVGADDGNDSLLALASCCFCGGSLVDVDAGDDDAGAPNENVGFEGGGVAVVLVLVLLLPESFLPKSTGLPPNEKPPAGLSNFGRSLGGSTVVSESWLTSPSFLPANENPPVGAENFGGPALLLLLFVLLVDAALLCSFAESSAAGFDADGADAEGGFWKLNDGLVGGLACAGLKTNPVCVG